MAECEKRRYTKKGAELALLDAKIARELKHSNKRKEQRAYYHRPCHAWHITSMPKESNEQMQAEPERERTPDNTP